MLTPIMNLKIKISLTIIFILTFFLVCVSQTIVGKIVRVSDGDTIVLLDSTNQQIRIRLHGIDCPENGQDFANVAKKYTSDLCFSKNVSVDVLDIDRYGRTIGVVWVDTINVNLKLLLKGLAWHYKHFDQSIEFAHAELSARENKRGLWAQPNAVPPWEYRRKR